MPQVGELQRQRRAGTLTECRAGRVLRRLPGVILSLGCLFLVGALFPSFVFAQATLENPAPHSFQSGIGLISGWACNARRIEIVFNGGPPQEAAYGTSRGDTRAACGDTDNGFGLLFNWNLVDDGVHTVQALADGVEFASVTVIVTTLGTEFLRGASGTVPLTDWPTPGSTLTLRWQQAQQNFAITDGSAGRGGGTSGAPPHVLDIPVPGSFQSGLGVISGWACNAQRIEITFDDGPPQEAASGTSRGDTAQACGDTDNGFGLLFNWNLLGDGPHTVAASADGVEFARVEVTVTTLGREVYRGLSHEVVIPDFPDVGTDVVLQWQEAQQNFVIGAALPTSQLVAVNPVVTLPAGVTIRNVAVRSLYADAAEVLARPEPSLLLAEDAEGTVLLGVANMNGSLLGERSGNVEISLDSTAVVLVALAAGHAVHTIDQSLVAAIQAHPSYSALIAAMGAEIAADKNFLDTLLDYPEIVRQIEDVAADLPRGSTPQSLRAAQHSAPATQPLAYAAATVQAQAAAAESPADCATRLRAQGKALMLDIGALFAPVEATKRAFEAVASARTTIPQTYKDCVAKHEPPADDYDPNNLDKILDDTLDLFRSAFLGPALRYISRVAGCAEEAVKYPRRAVRDAALVNLGSLFERPGLTQWGWLGVALGWHKENFEEARRHYQRLRKAVADGQCSEDEEESEGDGSETLEAPTNLRVVSATRDSITVAWGRGGGGEEVEYGVYVYANGVNSAPTFRGLVDNTSATIEGLEPGETLCITVTAISNERESDYAAWTCGTTTDPDSPEVSTNLRFEVTSNSITLQWDGAEQWDGADEWGVYWVCWRELGWEYCQGLEATEQATFTLSGLNAATKYCFAVATATWTVSRTGKRRVSPWTTEQCATTLDVPSGLRITRASHEALVLEWDEIVGLDDPAVDFQITNAAGETRTGGVGGVRTASLIDDSSLDYIYVTGEGWQQEGFIQPDTTYCITLRHRERTDLQRVWKEHSVCGKTARCASLPCPGECLVPEQGCRYSDGHSLGSRCAHETYNGTTPRGHQCGYFDSDRPIPTLDPNTTHIWLDPTPAEVEECYDLLENTVDLRLPCYPGTLPVRD